MSSQPSAAPASQQGGGPDQHRTHGPGPRLPLELLTEIFQQCDHRTVLSATATARTFHFTKLLRERRELALFARPIEKGLDAVERGGPPPAKALQTFQDYVCTLDESEAEPRERIERLERGSPFDRNPRLQMTSEASAPDSLCVIPRSARDMPGRVVDLPSRHQPEALGLVTQAALRFRHNNPAPLQARLLAASDHLRSRTGQDNPLRTPLVHAGRWDKVSPEDEAFLQATPLEHASTLRNLAHFIDEHRPEGLARSLADVRAATDAQVEALKECYHMHCPRDAKRGVRRLDVALAELRTPHAAADPATDAVAGSAS